MAGHSKGTGQKPQGIYTHTQQVPTRPAGGGSQGVRPEHVQKEFQRVSAASVRLEQRLTDSSNLLETTEQRVTDAETLLNDTEQRVTDLENASGGSGRWVSVEEYGVVGDGTTDDTAALQSALNNQTSLYIPDDFICAVSGHVFVPSGVSLVGKGTVKTLSPFTQTSTGVLLLNGDDILIKDITIDMNATKTSNIYRGIKRHATTLKNITIDGVTVDAASYTGIDIISDHTNGPTQQHENVRIQNCMVTNCGGDGIVVASIKKFHVLNNHVERTGRTGIATWGRCTDGIIQGNYVYRGTDPDFLYFGTPQGGLLRLDPYIDDVIVDSNVLNDNMSANQDGLIVGEDGVTEFGRVVISNNIVKRGGLFGIDVHSNFTVVGNTVEESREVGIFIGRDLGGPLRNVVVANNNIINIGNSLSAGSPTGISMTSNLGNLNEMSDIVISGNLVSDRRATKYTEYGIRVNRSDSTFTRCKICDNNLREVITEGIIANGAGTLPITAFTWRNNDLPNPVKTITANGASVFGYEYVYFSTTSGTVLNTLTEGYIGLELKVLNSRGDNSVNNTGNIFPPYGNSSVTLFSFTVYKFIRFASGWFMGVL